jgi:hypothetical protein
MTRRLARLGCVPVGVLVGLALCAGPAAAKVKTVAGNGVVTVGKVPCGPAPCTLRAPTRVRVNVSGEGFRAHVLAPRRIAPQARATVRVKFGAKAVSELAGHSTQVKVRVVLRTEEKKNAAPIKSHPRQSRTQVADIKPRSARQNRIRAVRAKRNHPRQNRDRVAQTEANRARQDRVRVAHADRFRHSGNRVDKRVLVLRAKVGRPASSTNPGATGGGSTPIPTGPPASAPIEGEPPVLARPATAVTVSNVQLSWSPRDSWVRYVSSGTAANDGVVPGNGATATPSMTSPCPDRPSEAGIALPYAINFQPKESWYDPLTGEAGIYASGSVSFRYTAHSINLTAAEPEIEINGPSSRAIFRFSGSGGTPYPNQRVALETLDTSGRPTITNEGKTLTFSQMRARLTSDGEKVFAGFYPGPTDNEFGCLSTSITLP